MDSAGSSDRRNWWEVRWSSSGAFRNERRQLIILSLLGGLVFFGAGLLSGVISTNAAASKTGSFSVPSKSGPMSLEATGAQSSRMDTVGAASSGASEHSTELKVRLYNHYTENNKIELYPWEHVAEPYKPSVMELLDWPQADENLDYR